MMRKVVEYGTVFALGALGYAAVELLWRGHTHWTMMLTGGACFTLIYRTERRYSGAPMWKRCFAGAEIITLCELFVGFFVNILLGWAVWDYSNQPLNLFGQICPLYFGLWFLLCLPASKLCALLGSIADGAHNEKKKRLSM